MSPIAPTLQALFTDRLITQRNASPETILSYRDTMRLLLTWAHAQTGKTALPIGLRRSVPDADRDVSQPPGNRSWQQSPHAQQPFGGDPFLLPLRRPGTPRARPDHRQGDGDPQQALPAQRHLLPRSGRDQGAAGRPRPKLLAGSA